MTSRRPRRLVVLPPPVLADSVRCLDKWAITSMDRKTATEITRMLGKLFSAFPTAQRADEALSARTYLEALDGFSVDAIGRSVDQFIRGAVPSHDGRFAPSTAELARNVKQWDDAIRSVETAKRDRELAAGILWVDFGGGRIDMTRLSKPEQDEVLRTGKRPSILGPALGKLRRAAERKRGFDVGDPVEAAE